MRLAPGLGRDWRQMGNQKTSGWKTESLVIFLIRILRNQSWLKANHDQIAELKIKMDRMPSNGNEFLNSTKHWRTYRSLPWRHRRLQLFIIEYSWSELSQRKKRFCWILILKTGFLWDCDFANHSRKLPFLQRKFNKQRFLSSLFSIILFLISKFINIAFFVGWEDWIKVTVHVQWNR